MKKGVVTINYTQVVEINLSGAPYEIKHKFKAENFQLKYRLGLQM